MVGETSSVVGYHLLTEGHSIQLGSGWGGGGAMAGPPPPTHQVQGSVLIITILILIIIFSEFPIKSQSNHSLKFLIKWFLNKKQRVCQTYDMKYLNAAGKLVVKKKAAIKIKLKNDRRSNEKIKKVFPMANIFGLVTS